MQHIFPTECHIAHVSNKMEGSTLKFGAVNAPTLFKSRIGEFLEIKTSMSRCTQVRHSERVHTADDGLLK